MNYCFQNILLLVAFLFCGNITNAQLPNDKFGKPSTEEWNFTGWDDAVDADAVILYKSMKVLYQLPAQLYVLGQEDPDGMPDNHPDFGESQNTENGVVVNYEFNLRTKILTPDGARHADIDITFYDAVNDKNFTSDELYDLKIKVFSKNEKGKVVKKSVSTKSFIKERLDDNYMVMHVVVPDVQPGDIIEYQYKVTSFRYTYLYNWMFQECIPTVRTRCDIEIPAFLQFNMNVPENDLVKWYAQPDHITYDANRRDMKKAKSCPSNHYYITGDNILPSSVTGRKLPQLTSRLVSSNDSSPAMMPESSTHLKIK